MQKTYNLKRTIQNSFTLCHKQVILSNQNNWKQYATMRTSSSSTCAKPKQYAQAHIPGAHFVNYMDIVQIDKPVMGLLPENENFSALLCSLGITKKSLIVAYDDEGGGCAARFVWTLTCFRT
jgi:3-mercaptopyruvate sulfurtransferase SseA